MYIILEQRMVQMYANGAIIKIETNSGFLNHVQIKEVIYHENDM